MLFYRWQAPRKRGNIRVAHSRQANAPICRSESDAAQRQRRSAFQRPLSPPDPPAPRSAFRVKPLSRIADFFIFFDYFLFSPFTTCHSRCCRCRYAISLYFDSITLPRYFFDADFRYFLSLLFDFLRFDALLSFDIFISRLIFLSSFFLFA